MMTNHIDHATASRDEMLLRETHHRCVNDLQLIVGLLSLQSRRAKSHEARQALEEATARVAVLAQARAGLSRQPSSLPTALRHVCEALLSQAEPRSILITLTTEDEADGLTADQVATLALVVNELATNAIKHAFEEGKAGHVSIVVQRNDSGGIIIVVDDDGLPIPEATDAKGGGIGLGLVRRLVASIDGRLIVPTGRSKSFEIRVPPVTACPLPPNP